MVSKFRLTDSVVLADTYQEAQQAVEALKNTEATEEDIITSTSEIPTMFLLDLLLGFINMYDKLLDSELAIYSTKKLYNVNHLH